jgi:hypothetical protein
MTRWGKGPNAAAKAPIDISALSYTFNSFGVTMILMWLSLCCKS